MANTFLEIQKFYFLLQENGGRIIIGERPDSGGRGIGKSIQKGVSLVDDKQRKRVLGNKPIRHIENYAIGKIVKPLKGFAICKTLINRIETNYSIGKILTEIKAVNNAKIIRPESFTASCKIVRHEMGIAQNTSMINIPRYLKRFENEINKERYSLEEKLKKNLNLEKIKKLVVLLESIPINYELLNRPKIKVELPSSSIQQGELLRVTATSTKQVSQLWMRILGSKGEIVQKAGLVKRDATGFQILVATQHLQKGKYTIQVSSSLKFSFMGIAQVDIEDKFPLLLPLILTPGILTPTPDLDVKFVTFRTMLDSRVDAKCRPLEGKRYRLDNKNKPSIPIHFGCRCFYELD